MAERVTERQIKKVANELYLGDYKDDELVYEADHAAIQTRCVLQDGIRNEPIDLPQFLEDLDELCMQSVILAYGEDNQLQASYFLNAHRALKRLAAKMKLGMGVGLQSVHERPEGLDLVGAEGKIHLPVSSPDYLTEGFNI